MNPFTDLHTIDRLAGRAANICFDRILPHHERHAIAHSAIGLAIAEHANNNTTPTAYELVSVGTAAIQTETNQWGRDHGITNPVSHTLYWLDQQPPTQPDDVVPPRLALAQVWAQLPARHQEALLLLALHGTITDAAAHAGVSYSTMGQRIHAARKQFYRLWFDHETPPALTFDRRTRNLPTHCGKGHEFTPENTRWRRASNGRGQKRACRACDQQTAAERAPNDRPSRAR